MIFSELKEKYPLLVDTANYLEQNSFFFRTTLTKIKGSGLDYELAEKLCSDCLNHVKQNRDGYFKCVHTLIDFSLEFLKLQMHLEKTGRYTYSTFKEIEENIYSNPNRKLKGPWYTWALYFSQIFWVSHWNVFRFFLSEFAKNNKEHGEVLEVPTGTGIYIAQFLANNPSWQGTGVDLGNTAIEFTKNVLAWNKIPSHRIALYKEDIYKFETDKRFDRIMCGEFLEHVEDPLGVLIKLHKLLKPDGKLFLTVAVYAEMIDHIYLYKSADEVRGHVKEAGFIPEKELVQAIFENKSPEDRDTPINYCAILKKI
ncbi:class I SAM-dependent methyltransferase [Candidatus Woesearchaeota archaeon]|nr:class I SAM-dependent methyltransferase [Candidatus Woesearchaeota archaeon]